jgi:hypothetical protein
VTVLALSRAGFGKFIVIEIEKVGQGDPRGQMNRD